MIVNREPVAPEFSRIVMADCVGREGLTLGLEATPQECGALAHRFEVEAISALSAHAKVSRVDKDRLRLDVTFDADVLQLCVITLEPVASHVSDRFAVVCAPPGKDGDETEVFVDIAGEDPPEPLLEGRIDVGEMIAQHLSLQIDPYPRAADAEGGAWEAGGDRAEELSDNPFDRLRGLKTKA